MGKKLLSLLLTAVLVLSLASCGGNAENTGNTGNEEDTMVEAGEDTVVLEGMELGTGLLEEEESVAELDENPDRSIDRAVTPIEPVPAEMLDGTLLTNKFYYYRSTLDETYQQAYDLIRSHLLKGTTKFSMTVPVKKEDFFDIYKKVVYDSPDLFWVEINGSRYSYNNQGLVTAFMPGYNDLVIMAAGAFTQGSSIELSADGPLRPPYTAFFQGGLTYESGKIGIMYAAEEMLSAE